MPHTLLNSRADFESAVGSNPGKFVLIYVYENEIDPRAEQAGQQTGAPVVPYAVDISKFPDATQALKTSVYPSVVVFKDGAEVKRLDGIDGEKAQALESFLKGQ